MHVKILNGQDSVSIDNPLDVQVHPVTYPMTSSASNTATLITQAGVAGKSWHIAYANWRVSGSAVVGAANLAFTMKDGTTVIYNSAIPAASPNGTNLSIVFVNPIKITAGNSVSVEIGTPNNPGCIIYCNVGLYLI